MLGTIQGSSVGSGKKSSSSSTAARVEKDLRRVLAHDEEEEKTSSLSGDSKCKRSKKGCSADCNDKSSSNESSKQHRASPSTTSRSDDSH